MNDTVNTARLVLSSALRSYAQSNCCTPEEKTRIADLLDCLRGRHCELAHVEAEPPSLDYGTWEAGRGIGGLTDEEHAAACAGEMANAGAREGEVEILLATPRSRRELAHVQAAEKSGSYGAAAMGSKLARGR